MDFNDGKFCCNCVNVADNWADTIFNGANGVPGGVDTKVEQISENDFKLVISWLNKVTVWSPNNKGSVASLSPKYILSVWNTAFGAFKCEQTKEGIKWHFKKIIVLI